MSMSAEVENFIQKKDIKGAVEQYKKEMDLYNQNKTRYTSQAEMYINSLNSKIKKFNELYSALSDDTKQLINYNGEYKCIELEGFEEAVEPLLQVNRAFSDKVESAIVLLLRGAYK